MLALAERLDVSEIATLDRRHFTVVRPAHVQAFTCCPSGSDVRRPTWHEQRPRGGDRARPARPGGESGPRRHAFRRMAARRGIAAAELELRDAVKAARDAADSWTVIASALDTTRQAAQQPFGGN